MTIYRIDPATGRITDVFTQPDDAPVPTDCITIPPPIELPNPRWNAEHETWEESPTQIVSGGSTGELP